MIANKRVCAAFLLSLMLTQTSCGFIVFNDPDSETAPVTTEPADTSAAMTETVDTTAPADTAEPLSPGELARARLEALPDRNFDGAPILIATTAGDTICPLDAEDAAIASRADSRRAVEEKFNTVIIANVTDPTTMLADAEAATAAGMYYAELLAIPQSMVGQFRMSGILLNMNSLPHANYDEPYYHQNIIDAAYAGDELYAVSGAASFNPDYLSCVYFNRTLAESLGIGDLYALVRDGGWTWDKLREYAKAAKNNLDGATGIGSYADNNTLIDYAASAHGIEYTTTSVGAAPIVNFLERTSMAERAAAVVDTMYNLIYKDGTLLAKNGESMRNAFSAGELLFGIDSLSRITEISDGAVEWGILPLPKYDTDQHDYLSPLSADAPVFCAIAGTSSYENSGLVLEGLNAASYGYTLDTYLTERINYHLRDSNSIGMLDIICEGVTTDFVHMYASGQSTIANATYQAIVGAVTTRSSLETLYKSYKPTADRELSKMVKLYD
ncbi:MAG: extracellular solute-binding protein [Ruminococcaceae bacterium]|nr:extracellular solute-binding protein [Oscillospiraceae bacterium]